MTTKARQTHEAPTKTRPRKKGGSKPVRLSRVRWWWRSFPGKGEWESEPIYESAVWTVTRDGNNAEEWGFYGQAVLPPGVSLSLPHPRGP